MILLCALLFSCSKDSPTRAGEFRIELTSLGGTRARITVAAMNKEAYYTYIQISRGEEAFDAPVEEIIRTEVARMEDSYRYFSQVGISGSFAEVFCYQGSRQLEMASLQSDTDFKIILFQLHPKTHAVIGEPVVVPFHTRPVPVRNLTFDVQVADNHISVTPSDATLTYLWEYEESKTIEESYFLPQNYLYKVAGMYQEYGFIDSMVSMGYDEWDLARDKWLKTGMECTLVVAGCEEGEFTTHPMKMRFRYNGPGDADILEALTECGLD